MPPKQIKTFESSSIDCCLILSTSLSIHPLDSKLSI